MKIKGTAEDGLLKVWERGPFPELRLRDASDELRRLFKYVTGRELPDEVIDAYDRVRAYLGEDRLELTEQHLAHQWLGTIKLGEHLGDQPEPEPKPRRRRRRIVDPKAAAGVDPHDLGD